VHKCDYCGQGFIVNLMVDIEAFCERLARMFEERPEQKLYRYDLHSDILAFEPEYGASEVLARCFAEYDKYLLLYTRSDNVEWLADLPCREHVPINWTLSMDTQARVIERDSPSLAERIEAMRFCQEQGFTVRAGFSPIIPVADWRRETTEMLELLFERVEPEVLRGWVLAMMEAEEFETMFDASMMDETHMRRMREEADALKDAHHAPFPLDVRAEIYAHYLDEVQRISPKTPFALCTEHPELWNMLEAKLHMKPNHMFCCCGGLSPPRQLEKIG
jgi:DNA repair photolyase